MTQTSRNCKPKDYDDLISVFYVWIDRVEVYLADLSDEVDFNGFLADCLEFGHTVKYYTNNGENDFICVFTRRMHHNACKPFVEVL